MGSLVILSTLLYINLRNVLSASPYISPMILGRTFDMSTSRVGSDLFDSTERAKIHCEPSSNLLVEYQKIERVSDKNDVLDIKGQLSFQVKAGLAKVDAAGSYLKESTISSETTEILVRMEKTTINRRLMSRNPIDFQNVPIIGQHYVKSITYGGLLIASLKFTKKSDKEGEDIQASLTGTIGNKGSGFDATVKGKFQMLDEKTKENYDMEISYYASIPLTKVPLSMDDFINTIESFGADLKTVTDEDAADCDELDEYDYGVPVEVDLTLINDLLETPKPELNYGTISKVVQDAVETAEVKFVDLQRGMTVIRDFLEEVLYLPLGDEERLATFYNKIFDLQKKYKEALSNIDLREQPTELEAVTKEYTDAGYSTGDVKLEADNLVQTIKSKLSDESGSKSAEQKVDELYKLVQDKKKELSGLMSGMETIASKMIEVSDLYKKKVKESFNELFVYGKPKSSSPTKGSKILFTEELLKEGNMYDPKTGTMTCPRDGYYLTTSSESGANMILGDSEEDSSTCASDVVPISKTEVRLMDKGDTTSVISHSSSTEADAAGDMFMGILLTPTDTV